MQDNFGQIENDPFPDEPDLSLPAGKSVSEMGKGRKKSRSSRIQDDSVQNDIDLPQDRTNLSSHQENSRLKVRYV